MASPAKKSKVIDARKERKRGRVRKAKLRNQGSTKSDRDLFGDDK